MQRRCTWKHQHAMDCPTPPREKPVATVSTSSPPPTFPSSSEPCCHRLNFRTSSFKLISKAPSQPSLSEAPLQGPQGQLSCHMKEGSDSRVPDVLLNWPGPGPWKLSAYLGGGAPQTKFCSRFCRIKFDPIGCNCANSTWFCAICMDFYQNLASFFRKKGAFSHKVSHKVPAREMSQAPFPHMFRQQVLKYY